MTTPAPSATGAHTRVTLRRTIFTLEIHGTLASFDRSTGAFTAFLDVDPAGAPAETFTPQGGGLPGAYTDTQGFAWTLVR